MSFVTGLRCPRCSRSHDHHEVHGLCSCGSPLLVEYDLRGVAGAVDRGELARRTPSMWRYRELLPAEDPGHAVTLGEGFTPLVPLPRLAAEAGVGAVWVKDEGLNPTGTFKARGASCGISRARELGVREVALPTAGNAGGAWACYGAAAGIGVHVAMPADAPEANRLECLLFGAEVQQVEGSIADAGRWVDRRLAERGWFDAGTLKEPYRIEGKKTLGFEIAEQLGWRLPDVIIYPAGGGVGAIGIWRGLAQFRELGWVTGDLPRLVVVQAEGCAPLVRAFHEGALESTPWEKPSTFASGLRVPKALGDFLVLRAVRETGGTAVAVADADIARAMLDLGREGVAAAPEGAATLAGLRTMREAGELVGEERVVLINTGSAQKYESAVADAMAEATPGDE